MQIGTSVRFRHPLVRSAVYRAASPGSRQRAHEALAEVSDPDSDADRRAWHRALAANGPDEDVAAELERSAARAQARGGAAATAAFLDRAVALTPDPARRRERALAAAQASIQAGAFTTARGLLAMADGGPLEEFQRAQIDLLQAQLAFISSRGTDATPLLLAAARRLESLDISLARETYVDAFSAAMFGARLNGSVGMPEVAEAARAAPRPPDAEPATADLLLDALVALADDYDTAVPRCREAVQRLSGEQGLGQGTTALAVAGLRPRSRDLGRRTRALALAVQRRDRPRDGNAQRTRARPERAHADPGVLRGPCRRRRDGLRDRIGPGGDGHPVCSVRRVDPLGLARQSSSRRRDLIETTEREANARGEGIGLAISAYARAVLCNGLGRYEEALAAAVAASEHREVVAENWGLSELIEPATRTGRTDLAADAQKRLARKAYAAGTDWALGIDARSRALLSEDEHAEGHFLEGDRPSEPNRGCEPSSPARTCSTANGFDE